MNDPFVIPTGEQLFEFDLQKPRPKDYAEARENRAILQLAGRLKARFYNETNPEKREMLCLMMRWLFEATTAPADRDEEA